jgi:CRP-like cAMP-binding protein
MNMKQHLTAEAQINQSRSQFLQEFHLNRLLPSLTAGIIVGIIVILVEISLAALIFSGELSRYVSSGIGFILLGTFVIGIVVALTSSFPGMVALPQDSPAAILALMATAIVGSLPASATSENLFFTVVAAIVITSLLTGAISLQEQYGETFLEATFDDMLKFLDKQELFESVVSELMAYFERQEVAKGSYLIRQGDPPEALYFIESGQVTVQLEREDGKMTRLRTMGFGTVVGELGFYLGQLASASVVVQQPGTIYRLSIEALKRMNETNPKTAALFHEFMAHLLAERLANTNNTLQALLD